MDSNYPTVKFSQHINPSIFSVIIGLDIINSLFFKLKLIKFLSSNQASFLGCIPIASLSLSVLKKMPYPANYHNTCRILMDFLLGKLEFLGCSIVLNVSVTKRSLCHQNADFSNTARHLLEKNQVSKVVKKSPEVVCVSMIIL